MKLSPRIYAKTLVESAGGDSKKIAARFWHVLDKNKQYRELSKILDLVDAEYAQTENQVFTKVFSAEALQPGALQEIETQLKNRLKKEILLKNIVKSGITSIIVKAGDQIIDLSLENKANKLKKVLSI